MIQGSRLSAIGFRRSAIGYQLSAFSYQLSAGRRVVAALACLFTLGLAASSSMAAPPPPVPPSQAQPEQAAPEQVATPLVESRAPESLAESPLEDGARDHWAFQPIVCPAIPAVRGPASSRNPLDAFIAARLEAAGLSFAAPADGATLARRLAFDLTGLPPEPEDAARLAALAGEPLQRAADEYVDRLLATPARGERWAQHWLDLARFAETDGYEHDKLRPDAWRYRDWVVDAFNRDLGYDQFVSLQIAGDELAPGDPAAAIATAFCLSGPDMPDMNNQEERRHQLLNELTGTVGAVLLGMQFGCAQCHDHKYDPLSQHDFYRLRAVFETAVACRRDQSVGTLVEGERRPARLWIRGDWRRPGPELPPAFPRVFDPTLAPFPADRATGASGRRSALAAWLVDPRNPLVARVIANRVWQQHLGRGLVGSSSDFGIIGDSPTHPELLDFLAAELVAGDWSIQRLDRLIVTSATYRQASRASGADDVDWSQSLQVDPANRLYSRFPRRRLEGEAIRDALLSVAGRLDLTRGGPGVRPPLPPELVGSLLKGQWQVSPPSEHYRRSLYVFARRNLRYPIFEVFDRPDPNFSCAVRGRSTTPSQALQLLNDEFSWELARRLAGRVGVDDQDDERVDTLYALALQRAPSDEERARAARFLVEQGERLRGAAKAESQGSLALPPLGDEPRWRQAALCDLALALLNCNEFVHIE